MIKKIFAAFMASMLVCTLALASNYYVKPATVVESDPVWVSSDAAAVHNVIQVDNRRTDVYVETGSVAKPFKTIQAAVDYVASLAPGADFYTINISSGVYVENVVLEDAALRDLKLQGNGYVAISPAAGNSLQSAASNDNLFGLYMDNIVFTKPVVLTGSNGATSFSDVLLDNVRFTGTSSLTATCINNLSLKDVYSERPFAYTNVAWSYIEGGQLQGTFSATMDSTVDVPSGGSAGTILANGVFQSGTTSYTIGGVATYTVAVNGSRWGSAAVTIPAGVTFLAYNSHVRGTQTNNGAVILRNSTLQGYVAGTGTIDIQYQPASQVANTPAGSIAATDVQSALNELDTEKQPAGSYLTTESDPVWSANNTASVSKTFYVDKKRVDVYTPNGSFEKPFTTIQAAINQVIANGDNSQAIPYTIRIATGVYAENLVLEDTHLVSLIMIGEGSRLQTQINPASGYALQSTANNANFYDLHMENIQFTKPTMMVGSANNNYFGYNFFFVNCYWPSTALATFKNMTYPSFLGDITKFSGGVTFSNITQASINDIGGFKTSAFTIETDETANKPYLMTTGTAVLASYCRTPNVTWSLLNITTMTGTALQIRGARHGISGETIPANAQILAYNSALVGNYVNNGTLTLYNSQVSGALSGNAPVLYNFGAQITNVPAGSIAATTVQAALNELDSEKLSAEVDPTVDTSAEIQTIIGAGVYATAAQGGTADTALQPNAITASGTTCTITAIVDGQITAASCV